MIPDGSYRAVLDRVEGDLAVLEVAGHDGPVELTVEHARLPEPGRSADSVFAVTVRDGDVRTATYDAGGTAARATDARERFDRLSERPPRDEE
jgi:hypothetical protein